MDGSFSSSDQPHWISVLNYLSLGPKHMSICPIWPPRVLFCSGSISTADGSALVKVGNTTIICGIKAVNGHWAFLLLDRWTHVHGLVNFVICRSWQTQPWRHLGKVTLVGACWSVLGGTSIYQTFIYIVKAAVTPRELRYDINHGSFGSHFVLIYFSICYIFGDCNIYIYVICLVITQYYLGYCISHDQCFLKIYAPLIWFTRIRCSLFSSQRGPTAPVFVALPARPTRRTSAGLQPVHRWSDRKVWRVEQICCACFRACFKSSVWLSQLWNHPTRWPVRGARKGNSSMASDHFGLI